VYNLIDGGYVKYMLADATGPTSKNFLRNYRNFLWIGDVILVIDDVKTYDAGKFDFLLHYADTAVKRGPDLDITKDKAGILFRPLYPETLPLGYPHDFPEKMKYSIQYGIKDRTTNIPIPYYVLSPPEKSDRAKFVNAIILLNERNKRIQTATGSSGASGGAGRGNLPVIEKIEGTNYIGLRIKQADKVTEIYINLLADGRQMHRNSSIIINGWETDAYISALTFAKGADEHTPENLSAYFISNGSYLRKNGKVVLSSLSKVFMNAEKAGDTLYTIINGQPLIEASVGGKNIKKLFVNGQALAPVYDRDKMLMIKIDELK